MLWGQSDDEGKDDDTQWISGTLVIRYRKDDRDRDGTQTRLVVECVTLNLDLST